jgi:hypothetical protein
VRFKRDQIKKKNYFRPRQLVVPKTRNGRETLPEHSGFCVNWTSETNAYSNIIQRTKMAKQNIITWGLFIFSKRLFSLLWCLKAGVNFVRQCTEIFESYRAAPYLKRLLAGFPPRRPSFAHGFGKWDLWWTKWRRGRFCPSTSVSHAKLRSFHQLLHHHTITRWS